MHARIYHRFHEHEYIYHGRKQQQKQFTKNEATKQTMMVKPKENQEKPIALLLANWETLPRNLFVH
jgi:hypothetical protein